MKTRQYKKTVFDPSVYDLDDLLSKGQQAAAEGFFNRNMEKRFYDKEVGGVNFRIYLEKEDSVNVTNLNPVGEE